MSGTLALEWTDREPPLPPAGLVALGPDATLLAERLSRLDASVTRHLSAVVGFAPPPRISLPPPCPLPPDNGKGRGSQRGLGVPQPRPLPLLGGGRRSEERAETGGGEPSLLALLGPHDWLPWSPGVIYLAPNPTTPALFLPTTQRPTLPSALVLAALMKRFPELRPPLALLPDCCFSLAEAAAL